MSEYTDRLCVNFIVKNKERLRYGSESPSKFIPSENGRRAIYVMSDGCLERQEVDYIVEAEQEKEDERIRKGMKSEQKERLEQVVGAISQAPSGKRAELAKEIIGGMQ